MGGISVSGRLQDCRNMRLKALFKNLEIVYSMLIPLKKKEGGMQLDEAGRISELLLENAKLKDDNDMLQNIIAQMRVTLNRLIINYVVDGNETM